MGRAAAMLVLRAHTGIHAGVGQETGTVDLPIQRERVTNFPVVRGPSLKGALRQAAEEAWKGTPREPLLAALFGPETERASDHAGALSVGDARLLLFPMRSLVGTFAWLTCPFALKRLRRDLGDSGLAAQVPLDPPIEVEGGRAVICSGSKLGYAKQPGQPQEAVVVEDYGLDVTAWNLNGLVAPLGQLLGADAVPELSARLALIGDDLFQNFVSFCTEVVTRVHLDDDTKTVKTGQLWTEELLPAESVLFALLVCADRRQRVEKDQKVEPGQNGDGLGLLKALCDGVAGRFQIGGNETVGYGVCHASWVGPRALPGAARLAAPPTPGQR